MPAPESEHRERLAAVYARLAAIGRVALARHAELSQPAPPAAETVSTPRPEPRAKK
jgi:hypothetical protein